MRLDHAAALVVLSGGQDSTICLGWARQRFRRIETITFEYGQRHLVELAAAARIAELVGVPNRVVTVSSLAALGGNDLTGDGPISERTDERSGLPTTFVPGRNLLFLTLAAAQAWQRGIGALVTGVCQTDFSGYPDCRESAMQALQAALRAGMDADFIIHTPLMHLSKAASIKLAQEVGAMDLLAWSHTCYNGQIPPCGACAACKLRAKGFAEAGCEDPLLGRLGRGPVFTSLH